MEASVAVLSRKHSQGVLTQHEERTSEAQPSLVESWIFGFLLVIS